MTDEPVKPVSIPVRDADEEQLDLSPNGENVEYYQDSERKETGKRDLELGKKASAVWGAASGTASSVAKTASSFIRERQAAHAKKVAERAREYRRPAARRVRQSRAPARVVVRQPPVVDRREALFGKSSAPSWASGQREAPRHEERERPGMMASVLFGGTRHSGNQVREKPGAFASALLGGGSYSRGNGLFGGKSIGFSGQKKNRKIKLF